MIDRRAATGWCRWWQAAHEACFPDHLPRWAQLGEILAAHVPAHARLVDLGCGCGTLSALLAAQLPGVTVIGVERDPLLVALANAAATHGIDDPVAIVAGDVLSDEIVELAGGPVDAVVSSALLHYFTSSELAALHANVRRSLHPGGITIAVDRFADAPPDRSGDRGTEWKRWWNAVHDDPELGALTTTTPRDDPPPLTSTAHAEVLRHAGFVDVELTRRTSGDHLLRGLAPTPAELVGCRPVVG